MKRNRDSYSVGQTAGSLYHYRSHEGANVGLQGTLYWPQGTVEAAVYWATEHRPQSVFLRTMIDGRLYHEWQERPPSEEITSGTGLKIVAGRWLRDLLCDLNAE